MPLKQVLFNGIVLGYFWHKFCFIELFWGALKTGFTLWGCFGVCLKRFFCFRGLFWGLSKPGFTLGGCFGVFLNQVLFYGVVLGFL